MNRPVHDGHGTGRAYDHQDDGVVPQTGIDESLVGLAGAVHAMKKRLAQPWLRTTGDYPAGRDSV
ncbi:MAG: hypothetical protein LBK73_12860 [Treponema sp.]|nr:hypothetical protein [Treponema sp.]